MEIADFNAEATIKTAEGDAKSKSINAEADAKVKKVNADADAMVTATVGAAEAGKIRAVGTAEADVIKQKIESMESGNYAIIEVARALAASGQRLVPEIVATGDGAAGGGSLVNVLLAQLVANGTAGVRPGRAPREGKVE